MRKIVWILVVGLSCFGCQKANEGVKNTASSLVGNWELQKVQAGKTAEINYKPGNGNRLEFTDSTYKRFAKGILTMSGRYTIVIDNTAMDETGLVLTRGEYDKRIIFDEDTPAPKIFLNISNDELTLLSGFFPIDGGSMTIYARN